MNAKRTGKRRDEAAIERDVRRTQDQMGETVNKLEEKMNPRDITRSAIGDEGADVAEEALEITRQNPIPVALMAVGLIWLLATSRSPAIRRITDRISGRRPEATRPGRGLRPRSAEPAPIGPPRPSGKTQGRRRPERARS